MECTMDIVYIRALQIETVIGIYEWERGGLSLRALTRNPCNTRQDAGRRDVDPGSSPG